MKTGESIANAILKRPTSGCQQQNPDGSWTEAEPVPYKPDTRTFWQRVWAVVKVIFTWKGEA